MDDVRRGVQFRTGKVGLSVKDDVVEVSVLGRCVRVTAGQANSLMSPDELATDGS